MEAGRFVGRVGGLAVALGVGAAVTLGHGAAWAQGDETAGAGASSSSATPGSSSSENPTTGVSASAGDAPESPGEPGGPSPATSGSDGPTDAGVSDPAAPEPASIAQADGSSEDSDTEESSTPKRAEASAGGGSGHRRGSRVAASDSEGAEERQDSFPEPTSTSSRSDGADPADGEASDPVPQAAAPASLTGSVSVSAALSDASAPPAAVAVSVPSESVAVTTLSVVSSLLGGGGDSGTDSPVAWVVAAAARRQLGADREVPGQNLAPRISTGEPATGGVAAPAPAVVANGKPVISSVTVGTPNPSTGVVTGATVASDPDGNTLKYSATAVKGAVSVNASTGVFTFTPTAAARHAASALTATPADKAGSVTVTVNDGRGGTDSRTVAVPILGKNSAPVLSSRIYAPNTTTGVVTGWVKGSDADRDVLTYSGPAGTAKGSIVLNTATGVFTYTPTLAARLAAGATATGDPARSDSFTITVTDGHTGGTVAKAVTVAVSPDRAPTAPSATVNPPNPISGVVTGTVKATDPDRDALTYTTPAGTGRGSVSINTKTGAFTYTPTQAARQLSATSNTAADKQDSFIVTITDPKGAAITQTVTVAIAPNKAPTGPAATVGTPNPSTGAVTGVVSATDPDGDPLKYTTATKTPKGTVAINTTTGTYTYTPTAAARHAATANTATAADKTDNFTVTIADTKGATTTTTVTVPILGKNSAPVLSSRIYAPNTTTGVVTGWVKGSDADRDVLSYSGPAGTAKGSLVLNTATGVFSYTPTLAARLAAGATATGDPARSDSFTITVTDGHTGGTVAKTVTVAVSPDRAPTAPSATVNAPNPITGVVTGTVKATDPDRDALTYTTPAGTGKGAVSINTKTGAFTYTPTQAARQLSATSNTAADKQDSFIVTITDPKGAAITQTVTVAIAPNKAPTGPAATVGTPNPSTGAVTGLVSATDPDGDPLKYTTASKTPKGTVAINTTTGTYTYTPTAAARHAATANTATPTDKTDNFTVTIADTKGATTTTTVTVPILGKNSAPVLSSRIYAPNATTGVVSGWVKGSDADRDVLTYSAPAGTAKGSLVLNTATGVFSYTPTAAARYNAALGTATASDKLDIFTVTVDDGHGGAVPQLVTVKISPNGKQPTYVVTSAGATAYTEQQGPVTVDGAVTVSNPASALFSGATATLSAPQTGDALAFTAPTGSGITGSYNTGTGVLTLTGSASAANYQTALRTVTFTSTTDAPTSSRTVGFVVTDGSVPSTTATKTITIIAVNDAPVVLTSAGPTAYTEQQGPVIVDGAVTVADPDSASLTGATATLNSPQTGDTLAFTAPTGSGITGSYNTSTGVLTLTGSASAANYQTALRTVTFTSTTDAPTSSRTVRFTVTDGITPSAAATKTIAITAVSDAPALAGAGGSVTAAPGISATLFATIAVTDPDSANLTGATVAITAGRQSGADVLDLSPSPQNGITAGYNASTGVLTLTGTASAADYQTALRAITFTDTSATPSEAARTVTVTVTDGVKISNTLTVTATVRVNHTPVVNNDAFSGAEDTAIVGNVLTNDTDGDADILTATLGTGAAHGILDFYANGSFSYAPYVNYHGTDSFTYTASDGFLTSTSATVTLTVTAVDDVLFQFVYGTGSQYWTPQAKAALQAGADRISALIATPSPVTLVYNVEGEGSPNSGYLAQGGSAFGIPASPVGYYNSLMKKITSVNHVDDNGAAADGNIFWNFGYTFSYDDTPAYYEYDFQTVAVHELLHSFGFQTVTNMPDLYTRRTWLTFDSYLVDQSGAKVIGNDYRWNTAYNVNLSGGNGGLYFSGPNAVAAYGGPVPLGYNSLPHLRGAVFSGANYKAMSDAGLPPGKTYRTLGAIELGMLKDLGYTVAGGTQTIAAASAPAQAMSPAPGSGEGAGTAAMPATNVIRMTITVNNRNGGHHGAIQAWYLLTSAQPGHLCAIVGICVDSAAVGR